jgi:hypothetical protein
VRLEHVRGGALETAFPTLGRGSMAGACDRQIGFQMLDAEPSEQTTDATLLAFHTGHHLHELVQEAMQFFYGMLVEVKVDLRPIGYDISGHADGLYEHEEKTIVFELKTKKSYPMKLARVKREPELHEVQQAGMYALAVDADAIHIVYLAKDNAGNQFKPRDHIQAGETVEWMLGLDDPVPGDGRTVREVSQLEAERINAIAKEIKSDVLPARFIPGWGHVETLPQPGGTEGSWRCRYCDYWGLCDTMPAQALPLDDVLIPLKNGQWINREQYQ